MKNMRFAPLQCIAVLALMMLITPLGAQTLHSGERSDDFTGIRRNMLPLPDFKCPGNKIPVGSNCVDMPVTPPQTGTKSWVSYFLGQSRPVVGDFGTTEAIATINQDGTITFRPVPNGNVSYPLGNETVGVPFFNSAVAGPPHAYWGVLSDCSWATWGASPVYSQSDSLYGRPPSDWQAYGFKSFTCPVPPGHKIKARLCGFKCLRDQTGVAGMASGANAVPVLLARALYS